MNPYYQNQQFGYPNQGNYYGFNQNSFQNYGYASSTQTIEAMYNTVHPYNEKQFLLSAFGSKPQYISIFLTLSHEDKLKMYMLMQQKKLYGEMSDKEAYRKILKQIAQKIQNFNLFHNADSLKKDSQNKSKLLESKIDLIVQQTFQKLNLGQSSVVHNPSPKKQQHVEQDQWVQSSQTSELQKQSNYMPSSAIFQSQKINEESKSKLSQTNNPVFNMFSFDNKMQEAMTHQIGLKTINQLQKKSIWQLQVDQFQIESQEPNFKQIFKAKPSTQQKTQEANNIKKNNQTPQNNQKIDLKKQQVTIFSINSASIYDFYKINSPCLQLITNNPKQQQQDFDICTATNHQQSKPIQSNLDLKTIIFENPPSTQNTPKYNYLINDESQKIVQNKKQQTQQVIKKSVKQPEQEQEFQFAQQNQQTDSKAEKQQNQMIKDQKQPQTDVKILDYQSMLFESVQVQTPSPPLEFNFLQALTQPRGKYQANYEITQQSQAKKLPGIEQIAQTLFQSQVFSQSGIPQKQQKIQPVSEKNLQTIPLDLIRSSLSTHNWQHQELLRQLKIEINEEDKQTIFKGLKNKSFECNSQFYLLILNYLRQISLQWSPEYLHMTQQYKIVKQLLQQSQRYTAAVDQDQQQKVAFSIKKTKKLLNNIYENSPKTQRYVTSLLDEKCEQKGLLYKFGRNLLNSSSSTEVFQKVINQDKKQILKSFIILYTIEKLSSISKLKFFSQKLMIYLGQQYQKYKKLDEQNLRQVQNLEQIYPKFIVFVKGLVKISGICQRMINILKLCCLKTNSNTVKLLKICKDIKIKYLQYDETSKNSVEDLADLQEVIKTNIERNKSVYDLHNDFFNNYRAKPICAICLKRIKNDGNLIQEIYYHYCCFNLSSRLEKQIKYFTQ